MSLWKRTMCTKPGLVLTVLSFVSLVFCLSQFNCCIKDRKFPSQGDNAVPLFVITPTFPRMTQIADMTRLGQTLLNVPNLLWIICEDSKQRNENLIKLLNHLGVPYEYHLSPMPEIYKNRVRGPKPKGVSNRNKGLEFLLNSTEIDDGVLYFADDDNTYDLRLFNEIRKTKKVSMFPVGLVTGLQISTPIVDLTTGKMSGFYDGFIVNRKFPVDMAGFAVNLQFIRNISRYKDVYMPYTPGYEEDGFLKKLDISFEDIDVLAENCTEIFVWHTQTKSLRSPVHNSRLIGGIKKSNVAILQNFIQGLS